MTIKGLLNSVLLIYDWIAMWPKIFELIPENYPLITEWCYLSTKVLELIQEDNLYIIIWEDYSVAVRTFSELKEIITL